MHRKLLYGWIVLALATSCDTESSVDPNYENYFVKYYGYEGNQSGVDLVVNGGYIYLLGNSVSSTGRSQMLLAKVDHLGNEQWSLELGSDNVEASGIISDANGDLIVGGTIQLSTQDRDLILFKISAEQQKLDSAVFGEVGTEENLSSLFLASDGSIVAIGSTTDVDTSKPNHQSTEIDTYDIYSLRLTDSFELFPEALWTRVRGWPGMDVGVDILEKDNDSFIVFGTTDRASTNPQQNGLNMFTYPVSNDNTPISATPEYYGQLSDNEIDDEAVQMIETYDGGEALVGATSFGIDNSIYMARVSRNGSLISSVSLSSSSEIIASSIAQSVDGNFIILGNQLGNGNTNIYLAKTGITGEIIWERSFGFVDDETTAKVKELSDGSIIILGTADLESQTKMCLIKTNIQGLLE